MFEVSDHLAGHFRGPGRDTPLNNTMITRENRNLDFIQSRPLSTLPFTKPERQFFKSTQTARGLGQNGIPLPDTVSTGPVSLRQGQTSSSEVRHAGEWYFGNGK
ncbi:hypothetical protein AA100600_0866 [Gluconobacter thailandicus F149-1 = NBRC 100600]|nr:hypothetical protein AA100600_0866 [Gluconobacter thailandicus F149-1 = NBRC 100600]